MKLIKIRKFILKNKELFLIILIFFLTRAVFLSNLNMPFGFDLGRDSIIVLDMILNKTIKLTGPWTSIPGLYSGCFWYYLLAPFYFLTSGHPIAGNLLMIFLILIQIYIAYKIDKYIAFFIALSPTYLTFTTSFWNPYPLPLVSFLIFLILFNIEKKQDIQIKHTFLLGFLSSLGFHFSPAFSIFYIPIIFLSVFSYLKRKKIKQFVFLFLSFSFGFLLPFVPFIVFELKHDFIQTKSVIKYFLKSNKTKDSFTFSKFLSIGNYILYLLQSLVGLTLYGKNTLVLDKINNIGSKVLSLILFIKIVLNLKNNKKRKKIFLYILWIIIPAIGLSFLHYNFWYTLGMIPAILLLVSVVFSEKEKKFLVFLLLVSMFSKIVFFYTYDKKRLENSKSFLLSKLRAISYIRQKAQNKPFASYHYVDDIYDFSYQYIYFYQALHGETLPVEFSYAPNVPIYIEAKSRLLEYFYPEYKKPEIVFYIIEKPGNKDLYKSWWDRQKYKNVIEQKDISDEIKVLVVSPN